MIAVPRNSERAEGSVQVPGQRKGVHSTVIEFGSDTAQYDITSKSRWEPVCRVRITVYHGRNMAVLSGLQNDREASEPTVPYTVKYRMTR